jgi:hypothetical protein
VSWEYKEREKVAGKERAKKKGVEEKIGLEDKKAYLPKCFIYVLGKQFRWE